MGVGRPLVTVLITSSALFGCGGGGASTTRSASSILDDLLRIFRQTSIDDVARGSADDLDNVFRANSTAIDDAFRSATFDAAVVDATATANSRLAELVRSKFGDLEATMQARVEKRLQRMLCEVRLFAQNQQGDVQIFRPWIEQQFAEIEVFLTELGVGEVSAWLTEKVNDKTSLYSLACFAWVKAT